jgi:hypothetical protein
LSTLTEYEFFFLHFNAYIYIHLCEYFDRCKTIIDILHYSMDQPRSLATSNYAQVVRAVLAFTILQRCIRMTFPNLTKLILTNFKQPEHYRL